MPLHVNKLRRKSYRQMAMHGSEYRDRTRSLNFAKRQWQLFFHFQTGKTANKNVIETPVYKTPVIDI